MSIDITKYLQEDLEELPIYKQLFELFSEYPEFNGIGVGPYGWTVYTNDNSVGASWRQIITDEIEEVAVRVEYDDSELQ